jgi:hypothetical protein
MFIPETAQKKTEKNFRKLLKDGLNSKIQLSVINASANMSADEWSVNITLNEMNTAEGIILSIKK